MKKISRAKRSMLCALLGSSLWCQLPVTIGYAADDTQAQIAADKKTEEQAKVTATTPTTAEDHKYIFALEGIQVVSNRLNHSAVGTKIPTLLSEIPQSVSVINREEMDARGATNMSQAMEYSAGVTASPKGNDPLWNWSMVRGFDVGHNNTAVDGMRLFSNAFCLWSSETYGMEQVEVLRGPASILHGDASPGGMFNQVTKRPTEKSLREIKLELGSQNLKSVAMDIGGPVSGNDKVLFRMTGLLKDQDLAIDHSSSKKTFFAPAITWKASDKTKVTVNASYQKIDITGSNRTLQVRHPGDAFYGLPDRMFLGEPGYDGYRSTSYYVGYSVDHKMNDMWSIHQNARYGHVTSDSDQTWARPKGKDKAQRFGLIMDDEADSYVIDTYGQAKWAKGGVQHNTIIGVDYRKEIMDSSQNMAFMPDLDVNNPQYGKPFDRPAAELIRKWNSEQTGIYLQDQMKFGKRWTALVGGRRSIYHRQEMNVGDDSNNLDQSALTGQMGLVYSAGHGVSPYISYSESFEPVEGRDRNNILFKPATSRQYELGIQYEPEHMNARFTAAIFDLRRQNVLTTDPANLTDGGDYMVQTGEITAKGLELEAKLVTAKELTITASYSLLNNTVTKDNLSYRIGRRPAGVAKHSGAIWIDTAVANKPTGGWSFGAGARYIGSRYNDNNKIKLSGIWLADAVIRYDIPEWRFALNVRNLFDKKYEASYGYAGEGLSAMLTATHRW